MRTQAWQFPVLSRAQPPQTPRSDRPGRLLTLPSSRLPGSYRAIERLRHDTIFPA